MRSVAMILAAGSLAGCANEGMSEDNACSLAKFTYARALLNADETDKGKRGYVTSEEARQESDIVKRISQCRLSGFDAFIRENDDADWKRLEWNGDSYRDFGIAAQDKLSQEWRWEIDQPKIGDRLELITKKSASAFSRELDAARIIQ